MSQGFIDSNYSLEDLNQFRDENGYIDLNRADLVLTDDSREKRGNENRIKNWVNFRGKKVLVKEENILEQDRNFGVYSELIMEELARQVGLQAARYDLIRYNGKFGVLSEMVNNPETEALETIYGLVGETEVDPEYPDVTRYEEVEEKLREALLLRGISEEEVESLINERRKQKLLQLFTGEADGHIENEAVIMYKDENGKTKIRMAPMFDNETSFLLDLDEKTLEDISYNNSEENQYKEYLSEFLSKVASIRKLKGPDVTIKEIMQDEDIVNTILYNLAQTGTNAERVCQILDGNAFLRDSVSKVRSKIAFIPLEDEIEDYPYDSLSENTIAYIRDIGDDDVSDFIDSLINDIDIEAAIENVESKIQAPIPQTVKDIVVPFIEMRKRTLESIVFYEKPCQKHMKNASFLYNALIKPKMKRINDLSTQIATVSKNEGVTAAEIKRAQIIEKELTNPKQISNEKSDVDDI